MIRRTCGALALLAMVAGSAAPAAAFVRTTTCRTTTSPDQDPLACREGETPVPIFWPQSCVTFTINQDGSDDVDFDAAVSAIEASFETWDEVSCSYLRLIPGGLTTDSSVGYNPNRPSANNNVVMFRREGWSHDPRALALTSVTYDLRNGQIVDADIEINDERFNFTTSNLGPLVQIDLRNTVTHEVGHVIGLDHTPVAEATMYEAAPTGETSKRDLAQDDIDGLCAIYPANAAVIPSCDPPPRDTGDDGCACATVASQGGSAASLFWSLLGLVAAWRLRIRRRPFRPAT